MPQGTPIAPYGVGEQLEGRKLVLPSFLNILSCMLARYLDWKRMYPLRSLKKDSCLWRDFEPP